MDVRTTCPYCGVGCGVIASHDGHGQVNVRGDPDHPANHGRLCSKGSALGETLGLESRILHPQIHGQRSSWEEALGYVANGFRRVVADHGPDAVAFYVSGQLLTESYYVANKLMKGFIGSANIDTNSRLCMSSAVGAHKRAFGADAVPGTYEDFDHADLIVLVGSNTAWCHPVLFQRIAEAKHNRPGVTVVVVDPRRTATCDVADLHLALEPGSDAVLFNGLLAYLAEAGCCDAGFVEACTQGAEAALSAARASAPSMHAVAERCGIAEEAIATFYRWFARTERVVSVFSQGIGQSSSGTDKINALINCHLLTGRIGRPGMGPLSLTGQPNAMGGREVGGLANQLAAHMDLDDPAARDRVGRFWHAPALAKRAGLKAVDLFEAIAEKKVKAVWIMGTNPVDSLPEADRARRALADCDLVVVSDCVRDSDTVTEADVVFPTLTWGERDGTVTNSVRTVSRQRPFLPPPGEARADWWIICQVARRMGFDDAFAYGGVHEIFQEHAALSGLDNKGRRNFDLSGLAGLGRDAYDALEPVQWPVAAGPGRSGAGATARLFGDGRFSTPDGRARLVPIQPRAPTAPTHNARPLVLNTGRVRDHWHTMTRTGWAARLSRHMPEPYCELHPSDARARGIESDGWVRVLSGRGAVVVRALISEDQRPGSVFVPMHWNDQFAGHARVNALVAPNVDPVSGQPEFKHTPVDVHAWCPEWSGVALSRRLLAPADIEYWARFRGEGVWVYRIAGTASPADWTAYAHQLLGVPVARPDWTEYVDLSARRYRAAWIVDDRLEACLFIDAEHGTRDLGYLEGLFREQRLDAGQRLGVLSGNSLEPVMERGPVVCSCFSVGRMQIERAVAEQGIETVEELGHCLQAGTNCGSCRPELKRLIEAGRETKAAAHCQRR